MGPTGTLLELKLADAVGEAEVGGCIVSVPFMNDSYALQATWNAIGTNS
jgi:hypothetical protein